MQLRVNCPRNSKNSIEFKYETLFLIIDQNNIFTVLIQTDWPTKISMPFLSSLGNLFWDAYTILQESVDNFEIAHKTC